MMAVELKKYIYEQKKIETILADIGCHNIKYDVLNNRYTACQPDGDNDKGVVIRNNAYLNYYSFSRKIHIEERKDIFHLIESVKHISFRDTIKYVHQLLDLDFSYEKKPEPIKKEDPLNVFTRFKLKRKRICNVKEIDFLDENILHDYFPGEHIDWLRQGIIPKTVKKFGLYYSYKLKRQIIPIRYWLDGSLMATNARTVIENYDEFGIKKYILSKGYNKTANLYGLWENKESIEQSHYITIFEAEKSVLKRDSLGDSTCVALQGHSISDEQIRIISSLNIREIIIALDKDVYIEDVRSVCDKFYGLRKVSYIYDTQNILQPKESPADASNKNYEFLFMNRINYDESEHLLYLESLKKKFK